MDIQKEIELIDKQIEELDNDKEKYFETLRILEDRNCITKVWKLQKETSWNDFCKRRFDTLISRKSYLHTMKSYDDWCISSDFVDDYQSSVTLFGD